MSEINIKSLGQQELATKQSSNAAENKVTAAPDSTSAAASRPDTVSLTDTGEQIQTLQRIISDAPDTDAERVASIKAAVESGTYSIDSAELAQNLTEFEGLFN